MKGMGLMSWSTGGPLLGSVIEALDPLVVMSSVRDESGRIIDFRYEWLNRPAMALLDDPGKTLFGQRMLEVDPAHRASGHFDAYRGVVESGAPTVTEVWFDVGPVRGWFEVRVSKLGDGTITVSRDISARRAAEEVAHAHEMTLRATFDSFMNPHVLVNAIRDEAGEIVDFVYIDANQKACEYNRIPRDQLIGARVMDLLPGHAGAGLLAMYAQVVNSGEPLVLEDFAYPHELVGEERRYDILAVKIGDGLSFTWRDVTDRYQTAQALRESEDRYRLLAENSSDVVLLINADGSYRWASPSVTAVLGWTPDEMIGKSSADFVSPDDLARLMAAPEHAKHGIAAVDEFRFRCGDDSYLWVSGRSTDVVVDGVRTARVVALRDVHEQRLARDRQAQMDQQYRWLVEYAVEVVLFSAPDRAIVWASPEVTASLGWEIDDLIGTQLSALLHPDDRPVVEPEIARLFATRQRQESVATRLRTKAGDYRWMRGRATPVLDDDGQLLGIVTGMQDVTDLMQADLARQHSEAMVRSVLDSSTDQILQYDPDGRVEYVNDEVARFRGISKHECIGRTLEELGFSAEESRTIRAHVQRVFDEGVGHTFETWHDAPSGRRWFEVSVSPVVAGDGTVEHVMSDGRDVTSRRATEEELADRASHDRLTGLANREMLSGEVERALASSRRTDQCVGLLLIDLDHFKNVNDSLGHEAGDQLLVAASARFSSVVRAEDLIARLGGDEFVVVLRGLAGIEEALVQAQRVVEAVRSPLPIDGRDIYVTASIGVTVSTPDSTGGDLLREADTALYRAKEEGRDRASVFTADLRSSLSERLQIEAELRPALERGEFAVWYQPQVDLATGEIAAVEALLRWHHPSGEVIAAERFLQVAEDNGLICDIGDWALLQACTQVARWNAEPGASPLVVSVNFSARQLAEADLTSKVAATLRSSGLDPTLLCVEITETTLLVQTTESRENLRRLAQAGIRLVIDDFGTGYASLSCLRDIHVDALKIDRSFVTGIATSDYDRRLVGGIIALVAQPGVEVIAEGVEADEQARTLRSLGCTTGQGFLYSPAVPAEEFARLRSHRSATSGS